MSWNDPIPLTDHVSRQFKRKEIHAELNIVSHTAFRLRHERDETELSVNRLEHYNGNRLDQLTKIYLDLKKIWPTINHNNNCFGILNAGETIGYVFNNSENGKKIRILDKSNTRNPSHHGIYDILPEEDVVATLLGKCVKEIVYVRNIKKQHDT